MKSMARGLDGDASATAVSRLDVITVNSSPALLKRLFDIAFSTLTLLGASPLFLLALISIPLTSKGSPFFLQQRVGKDGRIFNIIKFRTMRTGTEKFGFKTETNDSRLTFVGRLLRVTNIDELPQLVNVLLGDMSIVGPRPLSVEESAYIASHLNVSSDHPGFVPKQLPGLIGLEQVNRTRDLTYLERFSYNAIYEENWSISQDIKIFLKALIVCREVCIAVLVCCTILGISIVNISQP